jgi:TolA-binding protein
MDSNVAQLPITDKLLAWFEANKKQVVWAAVAVTFVGLLIWFLAWNNQQKQIAAGMALSSVSVSQAESGGNRQDLAAAYLKVAASYPNSNAGAQALLLAAGALFVDGKYAEAQAQFEKFTRDYAGSVHMGTALLGAAASLDAQGKSDLAATAYKDLIARHPNDSAAPQAKFALGRIYESQGKAEQARDMFEAVEKEAPMTSLGNEAGMRVEELKTKYPNLFPAAVAPTPTNAVIKLENAK